jgi:hypothetical protein
MKNRYALALLAAVMSSPLIAAEYINSYSTGNMPNENGQFVYVIPEEDTRTASVYVNTGSVNSTQTKNGRFVVFSLSECTINCASSEYISTSPANNMPDMNGRFIYKSR